MAALHPVVAVSGLLAETRIAAGTGVVTFAGGGDPARLGLLLQAAMVEGVRAVISFGIAGGLQPNLETGTVIVGRSVCHGDERFGSDPAWTARLQTALPGAVLADLAGSDRAVCTVEAKRALRAATGAAAVDMETHVVARLAARHGIPFAALRIVADPAGRALPDAAVAGMRADGSTDVAAVLRAVRLRPTSLPGLVRAALDARTALAALRSSRRRLTPVLGYADSRSAASRSASDAEPAATSLLRPALPEGSAKSA